MSTESLAPSAPMSPVSEAAPQDALSMLQSQIDAESQSEDAAAPEAVEKPKEDLLAPKFAALTRKEKQIKAYEAQVKAKEAELSKAELKQLIADCPGHIPRPTGLRPIYAPDAPPCRSAGR